LLVDGEAEVDVLLVVEVLLQALRTIRLRMATAKDPERNKEIMINFLKVNKFFKCKLPKWIINVRFESLQPKPA
jgi:hypothetical protein